jgi:transcriptional regulator with XRE-family HTH domain
VPKRKTNPTQADSKLARVRVESGVTRADLAEAIYISLRTLQELESGGVGNPGIKTLTRIAYALDVPIEKICEDEWLATRWDVWNGEEWEKRAARKLVKRNKHPRKKPGREVS